MRLRTKQGKWEWRLYLPFACPSQDFQMLLVRAFLTQNVQRLNHVCSVVRQMAFPLPVDSTASSGFVCWFAEYEGQSRHEIAVLLNDRAAIQFLIAWSLLEARCFRSYARGGELLGHCNRIIEAEGFEAASLAPIVKAFHTRFQDKRNLANLMHGHRDPDISGLLGRPISSLSAIDQLYLVVSVVFRYRNNIFHGAKGVGSWLAYKPQIEQCVEAMQVLITHAKRRADMSGKG